MLVKNISFPEHVFNFKSTNLFIFSEINTYFLTCKTFVLNKNIHSYIVQNAQASADISGHTKKKRNTQLTNKTWV